MTHINKQYGSIRWTLLIIILSLLTACKKDFLDAKSNQSLVVPSTLVDYQNILNNYVTIFSAGTSTGEIGAGDLYVTNSSWSAGFDATEKNAYIWANDIYGSDGTSYDWDGEYKIVFNANVVLDGLKAIPLTTLNDKQWNSIEGTALFDRGEAFYELSQLFCKPYDSTTAVNDLGIPLRLTSDVKAKSVRASVQQTYEQMISDLQQSTNLLTVQPYQSTSNAPFPKIVPTKTAALSLLARVYLAMGKYSNALQYADASLNIQNTLVDFNTLSTTSQLPISPTFPELIYYKEAGGQYDFINTYFSSELVDTSLLIQYGANDLRKEIFFFPSGNYYGFNGGAAGIDGAMMTGTATDEMYLIKAECEARLGSTSAAMSDLNTLLVTRWKTGTFVPYTATNSSDALRQILIERRKELCFRNLRWTDLRRLNKDPNFAITLTHNLNGAIYTLPPNDPRYVMPIGIDEIKADGIQQNPR